MKEPQCKIPSWILVDVLNKLVYSGDKHTAYKLIGVAYDNEDSIKAVISRSGDSGIELTLIGIMRNDMGVLVFDFNESREKTVPRYWNVEDIIYFMLPYY